MVLSGFGGEDRKIGQASGMAPVYRTETRVGKSARRERTRNEGDDVKSKSEAGFQARCWEDEGYERSDKPRAGGSQVISVEVCPLWSSCGTVASFS